MLSLSEKQKEIYYYFDKEITRDEADYIVLELEENKKKFNLIARKLKIKNILK